MAAAGLWVKVGASLPRHHKTVRLARLLDLDVCAVVGHLVSLWIYAVEFANDGVLTEEDLIQGFLRTDAPKDVPDRETIIQALIKCGGPGREGFIEEYSIPAADADDVAEVDRRFVLHDWSDYSGAFRPVTSEDGLKPPNRPKKKRGDKKDEKAAEGDGTSFVLPRVKTPLSDGAGDSFTSLLKEITAKYKLED